MMDIHEIQSHQNLEYELVKRVQYVCTKTEKLFMSHLPSPSLEKILKTWTVGNTDSMQQTATDSMCIYTRAPNDQKSHNRRGTLSVSFAGSL